MYESGRTRLFYKAKGFREGVAVTAKFWGEDLTALQIQTFTELEEGLYYLDYCFPDIGVYVAIVYEDGVKTLAKVFRVLNQFGKVYFLTN